MGLECHSQESGVCFGLMVPDISHILMVKAEHIFVSLKWKTRGFTVPIKQLSFIKGNNSLVKQPKQEVFELDHTDNKAMN